MDLDEFSSNLDHTLHCIYYNTAAFYGTLITLPGVVSDREQDNFSTVGLFFVPVSPVSMFLYVSSAEEDYR